MSELSVATQIALYQTALRIRRTELALAEVYKQQEIRTPTHFGVGQEAVAAGVCLALRSSDLIYSHHRGHNHYLAKGGSLDALVAELYGRVTGCSEGRGGSVHLTDRDAGVVVTSAILSQTVAVAAGTALALQMDRDPRVVATFFGDAGPEEGGFYETLNYAAIHKLPLLFVCENNLYSTESPLRTRQAAGTSLCERARAFQVPTEEVDGNDLFEVYRVAGQAIAECRGGRGPFFLECFTYRWLEHVGPYFDHEFGRSYRSQEEVESWMERCPIRRAGDHLVAEGIAKPEDLERWLADVDAEVQEAVAKAKDAPWPQSKDLFKNVY